MTLFGRCEIWTTFTSAGPPLLYAGPMHRMGYIAPF